MTSGGLPHDASQLLHFGDLPPPTIPAAAPGAEQADGSDGGVNDPEAGAAALPVLPTLTPPTQPLRVQSAAQGVFVLLASRCMDPDPHARPSFADIAAKLEIIRRALMA
jgi:hypothetical protein